MIVNEYINGIPAKDFSESELVKIKYEIALGIARELGYKPKESPANLPSIQSSKK